MSPGRCLVMIFCHVVDFHGLVERINEVLTTKTTIDSSRKWDQQLLMAPLTLRMWPCLYLRKMYDKTHKSYKGHLLFVQGSDWHWEEQDCGKLLGAAIPALWCRVWSGDSSRPRCQRIRPDSLRAAAMVLQTNVLFWHTIKENMRCGKDDRCKRSSQLVRRQADEFIQDFKEGYTWLSVGIQCLWWSTPAFFVSRVPFSMNWRSWSWMIRLRQVDTKIDSLIRQGLATSLKDDQNHHWSVIQDADRIIVMNDGQIDAIGRHEELLATNAIYQEVYEMQTQGKGEAEWKLRKSKSRLIRLLDFLGKLQGILDCFLYLNHSIVSATVNDSLIQSLVDVCGSPCWQATAMILTALVLLTRVGLICLIGVLANYGSTIMATVSQDSLLEVFEISCLLARKN